MHVRPTDRARQARGARRFAVRAARGADSHSRRARSSQVGVLVAAVVVVAAAAPLAKPAHAQRFSEELLEAFEFRNLGPFRTGDRKSVV